MFIKPLLFLALSLKALSLPTFDDALGKRHSGAWIATFDIADTGCKNASTDNDRTGLSNGACVKFPDSGYFTGGTLGASWGDIDVIEAFADEACTASESSVNITKKPEENGFCTPLSAFCSSGDPGGPCLWNSVKGHAPLTLPGW